VAARYHFIKDFDFKWRSKSGAVLWMKAYKAGSIVLVPNAQIEAVEKSGTARRVDGGQSASRTDGAQSHQD
jgi:hypothetical protein